MSQSANVKSVDAIRSFRVILTTFSEEARNALGSTEMELRRVRDWLLRDQFSYWQGQVKRRNELVSMARSELHRRRLSAASSDAISDTEQKENLRLAQRRLEEAEHKVAVIKKLAPILEHAITEYHGTSQPLGDRLTGSLVNSLAVLDRMVASLEAYASLAPPSTPIAATEPKAGSSVSGGSKANSGSVATQIEVQDDAPPPPETADVEPVESAKEEPAKVD